MGDATAAVHSTREAETGAAEDVSGADNATGEVVGATGEAGSTGGAGEETTVVCGTGVMAGSVVVTNDWVGAGTRTLRSTGGGA